MTKAIVIYYDGNENRAVLRDVPKSIGLGSAAPHVWGFPDDVDILAVIGCTLDDGIDETRRVTARNWHQLIDVYIDEILHIEEGEEQDP